MNRTCISMYKSSAKRKIQWSMFIIRQLKYFFWFTIAKQLTGFLFQTMIRDFKIHRLVVKLYQRNFICKFYSSNLLNLMLILKSNWRQFTPSVMCYSYKWRVSEREFRIRTLQNRIMHIYQLKEFFEITNGVKHGCILSPMPFL